MGAAPVRPGQVDRRGSETTCGQGTPDACTHTHSSISCPFFAIAPPPSVSTEKSTQLLQAHNSFMPFLRTRSIHQASTERSTRLPVKSQTLLSTSPWNRDPTEMVLPPPATPRLYKNHWRPYAGKTLVIAWTRWTHGHGSRGDWGRGRGAQEGWEAPALRSLLARCCRRNKRPR